MKFVKAGVFFAISFAVAWVVIFTFIQEPFHARVAAKLLWWETAEYPIYYYLLAALTAGLGIGISMTIYYYVALSVRIRARRREVEDLTKQNEHLRLEVERLDRDCEALREKSTLRKTERMPAIASTTPPRPKLPASGQTPDTVA